MATYPGTSINDLNTANPAENCSPAEINDAIRETKLCLKNTFGVAHDLSTGLPKYAVSTVSSSGTLAANSEFVIVSAAGGNIALTLPAPVSGKMIILKRVDTTNNTMSVAHANLVGGTYYLGYYLQGAVFMSDGTSWYIVSTTSDPFMAAATLGANSTTMVLGNLSLQMCAGIRVWFDLYSNTSSAGSLKLHFNSDTTAANYYKIAAALKDETTTHLYENNNTLLTMQETTSGIVSGYVDIIQPPSNIIHAHGRYVQLGAAFETGFFHMYNVNTITDITSITFSHTVALGLKTGSLMVAYRSDR